MRHTDAKLTMNIYTDPVLLDIDGAVDPAHFPAVCRAEVHPRANRYGRRLNLTVFLAARTNHATRSCPAILSDLRIEV